MNNTQVKTPHLLRLDGLENQMKFINSTTTSGQKCLLYALNCDVKETHRYFSEILEKIRSKECHSELLNYDYDVDYSDWGSDNHLNLNVKESTLVISTPKPLIGPNEISRSMNEVLDGFATEEIIQMILENIRLLKDVLIQIHLAIKDSRPNGEEMFHCLQTEFVKKHGAQVDLDFSEWEDGFDSDEVMRAHLKGKAMNETVRMMLSGVLDGKMPHMNEVDTCCYRSEIAQMLTKLIPEGMDFETSYAALRELADVVNGEIIPNFCRVGDYLYRHRKLVNAEQRDSFFYYLHVMKCIGEAAKAKVTELEEELNFVAPAINLKRTYLPKCLPMMQEGFDQAFIDQSVNLLMESGLRDEIARDWPMPTKRIRIIADLVAAFIEIGALKGSNLKIAALFEEDATAAKSFAKYIGLGKNSPIAEWAKAL